MSGKVVGMAAVATLFAATTSFSTESAEQAELSAAIDRWERLNARDYSYDFQQLCNCLPEAKAKVHIVVADGKIETLAFAEDIYYRHQDRHDPEKVNKVLGHKKGTIVPDEHVGEFKDIAEIMRNIKELMAEETPFKYDAVYDDKTGIPCRVYADPVPVLADDESEFVVSNFSFTPGRPALETGCAASENEFVHFPQPDYSD